MKSSVTFLKILAALSLSALLATPPAAAGTDASFSQRETAPLPYRMRADVSVFGNTSSLNAVDIAKVSTPPLTYAGTFIHPYNGFSWFVSRHYAVFSDLPDDDVRDALVLLELAWPQYARIFRWRPPRGGQFRQAIVYAHDRETLERCLLEDHLHTRLLGGLTEEGFACSYLYAGSPYQTRYILLHEATHLYQYCLSGNTRSCHGFMLEGIADYFSSHVFDPETDTLMVNVLDRAPIHNHLANGLAEWRKLGTPDFSSLYAAPSLSRGLSVLMTAFLQHDAALEAKWRLFCEGVVLDHEGPTAKDATDRAFTRFYGNPHSFNQPFRDWLASLTPTYEILSRDFDQQGSALLSMPPASPAAPARMRINIRKIHPQATGAEIQISRPPSGGDFAGLSQCGATFIISNTWSRGCVFSLTTPAKTLAEEIPVGAMKDFSPPFSVATALTNAILSVSVADQHGTLMTKHLSLRAPETNDTSITIFASRPGIEFGSALFPEPQKGRLEVIKLPEMAFPAFSGTPPFGPVTAWQFSAPFRATDKPAALSDRNARAAWKTAAAHPPTPVTPPLVNLAEVFGKPMAGLTSCASAEIVAEEAKTADLVIGVADSAKVFLNGAEIGHFTGKREWSDGNLTLKGVPLQKGANTLLIEQTSAGNAPLLSVRSRPPTP